MRRGAKFSRVVFVRPSASHNARAPRLSSSSPVSCLSSSSRPAASCSCWKTSPFFQKLKVLPPAAGATPEAPRVSWSVARRPPAQPDSHASATTVSSVAECLRIPFLKRIRGGVPRPTEPLCAMLRLYDSPRQRTYASAPQRPQMPTAGTLWESSGRWTSFWSGKRDLNPRPSPWQGDALPLSYSRICCSAAASPHRRSEGGYTDLLRARQAFCASVPPPRLASMERNARKYTTALHTENAPDRYTNTFPTLL